jgi:hypothetical protein
MKKIDYIITGDFGELAEVMIPVMKQSRFLSDKPNVNGFVWYPIDETTQVIEIDLVTKPTDEELSFLCAEFKSLTIAVMNENGGVVRLLSEGVVEEM